MQSATPEEDSDTFRGRHTCLFVGAGASKALFGIPIQSQLIENFLSWDAQNRARAHLSQPLARLLGAMGDIELVLSHYQSLAYPRDARRSAQHALQLLLLRVALARYFDEMVRQNYANFSDTAKELLQGFLAGQPLSMSDFFVVSTNYDTVVEDLLTDIFGPDSWWYPGLSRPSRTTAIPVLKLHGSINWMEHRGASGTGFSRTGKPVVLTAPSNMKLEAYSGSNGYFFERDAEKFTPILVPFVVQKDAWLKDDNSYWKGIFSDTWSLAETGMTRAKKILFWGYGLPPADYHMFSLLIRVLDRPEVRFEVVEKGNVQTTMLRLAALFEGRACVFRNGLVGYLREKCRNL